jgi:hypothetical protein
MSIREEIETALKPLLGEPVSNMWRAGFQIFEIGEQRPFKNRKGQDTTRADLSLHVSCDWYITRSGEPIVSSEDFGPGWGVRRDEKAFPFYEALGGPEFIIRSVRADSSGSVVIRMAGGYVLQIITDRRKDELDPDADTAQWRFLPKDETVHHFVVETDGIERY